MRMFRMGAADEGVQTLDFVDKSLRKQEIERTVDGWWCGAAWSILHTVEDLVGTERDVRLTDKAEYRFSLWCQARPFGGAEPYRLIQNL